MDKKKKKAILAKVKRKRIGLDESTTKKKYDAIHGNNSDEFMIIDAGTQSNHLI